MLPQIRPSPAKFSLVGDNSYALVKQGRILVEIAPLSSPADAKAGHPASYDWASKTVFYLNAQDLLLLSATNFTEVVREGVCRAAATHCRPALACA